MTEEAIRKINDEMQENPQDTYTEILGHYLIDRAADPGVAARLLEENKNLKGAMKEVMAGARKKQKGNVAVMTPDEVFDTVDTYFSIPKAPAARYRALGIALPEAGQGSREAEPAGPAITVLGGSRTAKRAVEIDLNDFL